MTGGLLEEAEAEQHPRPGLGRAVGPTIHQPSQRQIREALGQFEATASRQFQLLATPGGSKTQPRCTVPQHLEALLAVQTRQRPHGVNAVERQRQAEQSIVAAQVPPSGLGSAQQVIEA
jgi:hypothetical protein